MTPEERAERLIKSCGHLVYGEAIFLLNHELADGIREAERDGRRAGIMAGIAWATHEKANQIPMSAIESIEAKMDAEERKP